jgi:sigma-B regulation protein RsbU (phosphoserine phosphatase)
LENQLQTILRDRVADIIFGTVFLFVGFAACSIAAMRRQRGVRVLIWLGIWSAMYGARPLADSLAAIALLPHWFQVSLPYLDTVLSYLILVVASLAFLELTTGKMRFFLQAVIVLGLAIGLAGIGFFIFTGSNDKLIPYNNLLATCSLLVLVTVVAVPSLSRKFLVLPDRGVLAVGTLVFATEALSVNLVRPLGYHLPQILDSLGFAALLFSLGYVALQMVFASERRLLSIENELEIAREIQNSILPSGPPDFQGLRIHAAYRPMTAVAVDFYDFVPVDQHRVGFLVADVSGHGVPAALIAAMIKVAMQSVVSCAHDPAEVLRRLNRTLSGQLRDQFVTAAYLWLDTENRQALYSAAGHPPLLCWRKDTLERIESNGLVFGITPDPDYPVREIPLNSGDRFLFCTDGILEPENAAGDFFGDRQLEQVIRNHHSRSPSELSEQLLSEIAHWRPASVTQQDDITLIVIDVV